MAGELGNSLLVAQADTGTSAEAGAQAPSVTVIVDGQGNPAEVQQLQSEIEAAIGVHEVPAGEEGGTFPPFDPSTFGPQLFWLALTFGTLYLLMSKLALPRIGEILEVRRDRIEGDLAEAERLRKKTDQAISAYESDLATARAKSQNIAEETRTRLKSDLGEKRAKVEADLAKKVATAETRIQKTKAEALANVDDIAADTAVALMGKLTGKISIKAARAAVANVVKE